MILVHILCLFLHLVIGDQIKFAEKISTRSTAAKGILLCGNTSANDVKVRLFRKASDDIGEVLSTNQTTLNGHFQIEGDTVGRTEQDIDPVIRFYHRCDDDLKKDLKKIGYRTFAISYPKEYVTIGRVPRKPFDIGKLNLQIIYPRENRDMKFVD
ncbi:Transthyretin-like family protein [Brugia malayi]|uniref:BMA-TTR-48 n=1 Tax=Brugia malayi TaxID=6279 RepID=A0A0H5SPU8_BRUMA|nr:Transthyretin-like family protein [Brugia malayi]CRZ25622.1 BMA-TTR-48 [Brugia malayi]VIO93373.1 Transthyretin-like family protein [Brugia malayi]